MKRTWAALALATAACGPSAEPGLYQGYVEGEYVYIAAPFAGPLQTLSVARGQQVVVGDPLFTVDSAVQAAAREEALRRVAEAWSRLEDARKGERPSELQSLQSQLDRARAALDLAA